MQSNYNKCFRLKLVNYLVYNFKNVLNYKNQTLRQVFKNVNNKILIQTIVLYLFQFVLGYSHNLNLQIR